MVKKWVIPDIHGCLQTLKVLIENQIKPNKNDQIYFLGDYIDRGPNSKGVIDYIRNLQENEYNVTALIGNHEEYCIKAWDTDSKRNHFLGLRPRTKIQKEWEIHGGTQTMESFNVDFPRDIPEDYITWMRNLPYYAKVDNFVLVHAGLNFKVDDPFTDKHSMLWVRDYKVDREKIGGRKVIHGHVPVNLEFIDLSLKDGKYNFVDLDNGVYYNDRSGYGNLMALELNSMTYVIQSLMDDVTYRK